ncbi:MAG: SdiA-regulated domain-containing protein [Saprospirales bacterium]|nr:SdiA-regulated domain-containing protein [Saprospirales bacterium]
MQHLLLFLSILAQGCNTQPPLTDFPYQLDSATQTFQLPVQLKEISGLSLGFDSNTLFAIEDETGLLFLIDKNSGAILQEVPFWKEGDYESVEIAGEDVFVGKSNGNLYQIQHPASEAQTVVKHESPLGKTCDVEGLTYEREKNRLLLSCKGDFGVDHSRAVFAFDLNTMTYDSLPAYVISWGFTPFLYSRQSHARSLGKAARGF